MKIMKPIQALLQNDYVVIGMIVAWSLCAVATLALKERAIDEGWVEPCALGEVFVSEADGCAPGKVLDPQPKL